MERTKRKNLTELRRKARARAKIFGTKGKPRLSVFRSNRHMYLQLIDDESHRTLVSASYKELSDDLRKRTKAERAAALGELLAQKAKKMGISEVVFDRGAYRYHGRVRAAKEGAVKAGLKV